MGTRALEVNQERAYKDSAEACVAEEVVAAHAVEEAAMYQLEDQANREQDLRYQQPSSHGKLPPREAQYRLGSRTCQIWPGQMRCLIAAVFVACSPLRVSTRAS